MTKIATVCPHCMVVCDEMGWCPECGNYTEVDEPLPANYNQPVKRVFHHMLDREGSSQTKSVCPVCKEGVLLMRRDNRGLLMPEDTCMLCAQQFYYVDVADNPYGALVVAEETEA